MKKFSILMSVITGLLFISTMICGYWINANHITEVSSLTFHSTSAIATCISMVISFIVNRLCRKNNKATNQ